MWTAIQTLDVKNLSSRKLWELVNAGNLSQHQQQQVEAELLLRRQYLETLGSLHPASNDRSPSHPSTQ